MDIAEKIRVLRNKIQLFEYVQPTRAERRKAERDKAKKRKKNKKLDENK
jgi:hypothetical protein